MFWFMCYSFVFVIVNYSLSLLQLAVLCVFETDCHPTSCPRHESASKELTVNHWSRQSYGISNK
jgi:hypothetical protein